MTQTFTHPDPDDNRIGATALTTVYAETTTYLEELITLSAGTKHYDVFIDGATYRARRGDVDDVVDSDTDVGALLNRLFTGGGAVVQLKTLGTYNSNSVIAPPDNSTLLGRGPGTVIKAIGTAGVGTWTTGSNHLPGSYMFDVYNAGAGRKWVTVKDIWFDCNNVAEGGVRFCGLASDTTQWNYFAQNFVANFRVLGVDIEDQSTSGGTRQYVWFNKIGPGTTGLPTRGMDVACNDVHLKFNDIFRVSDVGLWLKPRGVAGDKSVGTWWIEYGHVHCTTFIAGGVSPDTSQPINVLVTSSSSSGNLIGMYIDNVHRYGVYCKPAAGNKQSTLRIQDNWFNGGNLTDLSGSDLAAAVVLDASNVGAGDIYNIKIHGNQGNSSYTKAKPTSGRWVGIVSLRGGLSAGNNYVEVDHNSFRGALAVWDPLGARPDNVGGSNYIQPANNNTSQGKFSGRRSLWTTLQNMLSNASLLTDANADLIPDGWVRSTSGLTPSYPANGTWQGVYPLAAQLLYQDFPVIAGQAYSASAQEQVTVDAAGTESARVTLQFFDETGTQVVTGGGPFNATSTAGLQGPTTISTNNRTAPVDDGFFTGTVDTTSGAAAIVAKTGTFANDLTSVFVIEGAGAGGADLITTLASYTDSTHATLAAAPSATIADAVWTHRGHGDARTGRISLKASGSANVTIQWADVRVVQGATTGGQSGANTSWTIAHGLPAAPSYVVLTPANGVAAAAQASSSFAIVVNATNIVITTPSITAPSWYWEARL